MAPGPAIIGEAKGTMEISASFASFSISKKTPLFSALRPTRKSTTPPAMRKA